MPGCAFGSKRNRGSRRWIGVGFGLVVAGIGLVAIVGGVGRCSGDPRPSPGDSSTDLGRSGSIDDGRSRGGSVAPAESRARNASRDARGDGGGVEGGEATAADRPTAAVLDRTSVEDALRLALERAREPTADSVADMVRDVFGREDPRASLEAAIELLASGRLGFEESNAACLLLEAALRIGGSEEWRARFGEGDRDRWVAALLRAMPSFGDDVAARMASVLSRGRYVSSEHFDGLAHVLATRPLPRGAIVLLEGLGPGGVDFVLGFFDSDLGELRDAAMRTLVEVDDGAYLPLVRDRVLAEPDPEARLRILRQVAEVADPGGALELVLEVLQGSRGFVDGFGAGFADEGSGLSDPEALALFRTIALRAPPEAVGSVLDRVADKGARVALVSSLGAGQAGLLAEWADRSDDPDVRGAALVAWSRFASADVLGDRLVERLRSDAPEAAILAAGNLLARSRSGETSGGPAEERTVADLRRILLDRVLDPRQPISLRADALRAIAPGLDKESAARLRAADLPEELARRLPE